MSETDCNIPSTSLSSNVSDSVSNISDNSCAQSEMVISEIESDKLSENAKLTSAPTSKIARPTGLKLPGSGTPASTSSRIARLCNNALKPSLPPTLPNNGFGINSKEIMSAVCSIEKISEELARRRLADIDETNENKEPPYQTAETWMHEPDVCSGSILSDSSHKSVSEDLKQKKSSGASISGDSLGEYWNSDLEPRQDTSMVLTENTDQFIIGDRVWVGGIKPGQIAYIGETQFAPGEWAGVVLDEPIGKNDGTVANIRYFQCEPKRGIFSRLTRLTRYPLADGGAGEPAATKSVPNESKKNSGSLITSIPKKSPLVLTPTPVSKNSVSKPTSPDSGIIPGLVVGDRVIVKSSQGSKAGILRYLGTTDFAPGEWCGVELDDPLGKNDGSVAGVRYFECRPKFGLFAPLHKVSKSPANKRMFQPCVVHKGGGTSTRIRRQGSKESLVSLSSTASTNVSVRSTARKTGVRAPTTPTSIKNALQETLKEKEFHIEQLLKERDLERAEVTRAASQADEAERQLATLKQEFEHHKEEAEARISDLDAMVCLLKSQNDEMSNLLEDERKKYEDLLFRFEEETIDKADIKSSITKDKEKIDLLEKTLNEERKRIEILEQDSNKLFESEEQMVILKDELDVIKEELEAHKKIRSTLEQEQISLEAHLTSARANIESLKIENETLKASVAKDESNVKEILTTAIQKLEDTKKELEMKQAEVEQLSKELINKDKNFEEKEKDIHNNYIKIMQELKDKHTTETNKIIEEKNNDLQSKLKVLQDQLDDKMTVCSSLEAKLNEVNILMSKNDAEKNIEQKQQKDILTKFEKELKECKKELKHKNDLLVEENAKNVKLLKDIEKLEKELIESKNTLSLSSESASKEVVNLKEMIAKQNEELNKWKSNAEAKLQECESLNELLDNSKKENLDRISKTEQIIHEKDLELQKLIDDLEKLQLENNNKIKEVEELRQSQEENFTTKIRNLEENESKKQAEIETNKQNLEALKIILGDREKEVEVEKMNNKSLQEKLEELQKGYEKLLTEKNELQLEAGDASRKLQSAEEKLGILESQKAKLETDLSTFINSSNDSSLQLSKLNEDLRNSEKNVNSLREEISEKTIHFERVEQELKQSLEKNVEELKNLKDSYEKEIIIKNNEIETLKNKNESSTNALIKSQKECEEKWEQSVKEAESKIFNMEEKIKSMEKDNIETENKHKDYINTLKNSQNQLQKTLDDVKLEAVTTKNRLEKEIQDLNAERIKIIADAEETKKKLSANEEMLIEKAKKDAELSASESEKLTNELKEKSEELLKTIEELNKVKDEKNKLNEEKLALENSSNVIKKELEESQTKNKELIVNVSSIESENKVLKETINQLREEKCHLDKDLTNKMMMLTELNSQLKNLENSKEASETERNVKISDFEKEVLQLKEEIKKTDNMHSTEILNKNKEIESLQKEISKFKEETSQTIYEKENTIKTANGVIEQMKKDFTNVNEDSQKKSEKISAMEKSYESLKADLNKEKEKCKGYENKIKSLELERSEINKKFEDQAISLAKTSSLSGQLAEATKKLNDINIREQDVIKRSKAEKEGLEKELEAKNNLLSLKEKETILLIKETESLKQEKVELQKKIEELKQNSEKLRQSSHKEELKTSDSTNDHELEKGQINFLNSVIVDMQKKNDALKARIEILEMGFSPEDAEEFNLHNLNARSVAPRLFCDICDRFDLHDTEDCPTQATEDEPPPKSSKTKVPPPERPYCETCEVFGHDTADCDDAETF